MTWWKQKRSYENVLHQGAKRAARHGVDASVKEQTSDSGARWEGHGFGIREPETTPRLTHLTAKWRIRMPSALITGANRGLGLEFSRQYSDDSWQVYAACRDPKSASELRQLADASDRKLRIMALDVTDPTSVKAAAAELRGAEPLMSSSTMPGSAALAVRESETSITKVGHACSTSTLWARCESLKHSSTM